MGNGTNVKWSFALLPPVLTSHSWSVCLHSWEICGLTPKCQSTTRGPLEPTGRLGRLELPCPWMETNTSAPRVGVGPCEAADLTSPRTVPGAAREHHCDPGFSSWLLPQESEDQPSCPLLPACGRQLWGPVLRLVPGIGRNGCDLRGWGRGEKDSSLPNALIQGFAQPALAFLLFALSYGRQSLMVGPPGAPRREPHLAAVLPAH